MTHLDHKTAEAMKKAGFPQRGLAAVGSAGGRCVGKPYIPTLEEVIDELGEKFARLHHWPKNEKHKQWEAQPWIKSGIGISYMGATPLQAVCNLYLALNKK